MKKSIIITAVSAVSAILLSASCSKQEAFEIHKKSFTGVIEQDLTKTTITSAYKVNWETGDQISINGAAYAATPKGTGNSADFSPVSTEAQGSEYTAIFPASLYNNGSFEFPATQTYSEGKFNAPMYATSSTESLSFKNICGVLCIKLKGSTGGIKVNKISITSAGERVCGPFSMNGNNVVLSTSGSNDDYKTITLNTGEINLNKNSFTSFYVYLPPQTYAEGLKVEMTTKNGTATKTTSKSATVASNNIYTFEWTL